MERPDAGALAALEARVERALASGEPGGLEVLGWGEISAVLSLESGGHAFACKRLPPFPDASRLDAYRATLEDYLAALASRGVRVVPSALVEVARPGARIAYLVQPRLDPGLLLPAVLARAPAGEAERLLERLAGHVAAAVGPGLGLDGQVSNWAVLDGELAYLDVTTPLLRDGSGAERLDTDLFVASIPWALRGLVRRLLLREILDKYYDPRGVLLDALANLVKERLEGLLPAFARAAGARVHPALDPAEARRAYAADARMWRILQALRRLDRALQRARGRVYPFLLPGRIERHV